MAATGGLPRIVAASDMPSLPTVKTGEAALDEALAGGVMGGLVTEVAGEAGAGKTQFALQMAIRTALPVSIGGLGGRAVFLHTEGRFPVNRLRSMANAVWASLPETDRAACEAAGIDKEDLWNCHLVMDVSDADMLLRTCDRLSRLAATMRPKLVVIDSIAHPFRSRSDLPAASGSKHWISERSAALFRIAVSLRRLASELLIPVLVTNQVTAIVSDAPGVGEMTPALGIGWAHCVHTRLVIVRPKVSRGDGHRVFRVVFHPTVGPRAVVCKLRSDGFASSDVESCAN
jgi:RecA/RadA recombinase